MSLFNFYSEKISLPISDVLTGKRIGKYLKFLEQSQYWPTEQISEHQNDRVRKLIRHVFTNVPFYRDLYSGMGLGPDDVRTVQDLAKLPILDKAAIREGIRSGRLMDSTARMQDLEKNNSSGSTGEPLQFYFDQRASSFRKAKSIRNWKMMSFRLGDKILRISQIPRVGRLKKTAGYRIPYRLRDGQPLESGGVL